MKETEEPGAEVLEATEVPEAAEAPEAVETLKEVNVALEEVRGILDDVRSETSERLHETDPAEWLGELADRLEAWPGDIEGARLVGTALGGLMLAVALLEGDEDFEPEMLVSLVAFAVQVYEYVDKEHHLADLERAAARLDDVLEAAERERGER